MKSSIYSIKYLLFGFGVLGLLLASYVAAAGVQQPVYVYLYARVSDHVNLAMTEDRLRRVLASVDKYRQAHPDQHASATILFSGAVSKALEDRNAQTHIVDFVRDYVRRGIIEPGYDGTDEPTYEVRPVMKLTLEQAPQERWKIRQTAAEQFLSESRDPLTGAVSSGTGGLKAMQEVFGKAAYIRGLEQAVETYRPVPKVARVSGAVSPEEFAQKLGTYREAGGDTETLQMLAKYNSSANIFGISGTNPAQLPGYRNEITHFGELMSPLASTAPEVYWQDYVLRISEAAPPVRNVKAVDGIEALKGVLDQANRSKVQVVQVELGALDNYLQPAFARTAANAPLRFAYEHPQAPQLAPEVLRSAEDVNAGFTKEDALLKWVSEDFFHNNPGSNFVSNAALSKMAGASYGYSVSTDSLRLALDKALQTIGGDNHLFDFLQVDGRFLSLAELFQVLTDELAEYHQTSKLPPSMKVARVYGPFRMVTGHGPNVGDIPAGDLETLCAQIAPALHDETAADIVPKNSVPPLLKLNGLDLNPAQMIRLMGMALDNPAPERNLNVRMVYTLGAAGTAMPKSRPLYDIGFVWTLKPAPLGLNQ